MLYWNWIGKINGCSLLISETGFSWNLIESNKKRFILKDESDFRCFSEVVVGVLMWL